MLPHSFAQPGANRAGGMGSKKNWWSALSIRDPEDSKVLVRCHASWDEDRVMATERPGLTIEARGPVGLTMARSARRTCRPEALCRAVRIQNERLYRDGRMAAAAPALPSACSRSAPPRRRSWLRCRPAEEHAGRIGYRQLRHSLRCESLARLQLARCSRRYR